MSESVTLGLRRSASRLALTAIAGIWLSGCAESTRFADAGNPFSNPFANTSAEASAPTPRVSSAPLSAPARPSPSANGSTPAPWSTGSLSPRAEPVGGSASGWSAEGGSPVVVGDRDDAESLSARYGVPKAALLSANGLHSSADLHGGMRIVIPVYSAHGDTHVAHADETKPRHVAKADDDEKPHHKAKKTSDDDADSDDARKAHKDHKQASAEDEHPHKKVADAEDDHKSDKADARNKVADATPPKADKPAKSAPEAPKKSEAPKTPAVDKTPVASLPANPSPPSAEANESGQFRWPARGRIIMGFKQGGNDGINIALPEGTSVRAAEDGKVAYAGSGLKGYGNLVLIKHTNGYVTAYANNGELNVKIGESVKRGQVIAKSGQTGDVSTPQLHFELRKGPTPVDPTSYLAGL